LRHLRHAGQGAAPARTVAALAVCAGIVLVWAAYELGQRRAGHNRFEAQSIEAELRDQLLASRDEARRLKEQVALLETSDKVKAEAYRQVEGQLGELQVRIQEQQEDLAFYRGIVAADEQTGLRVQDFGVFQGVDGAFKLRLVLAQALRNNNKVAGIVELDIEGERGGEPAVLGLRDVSAEGDKQLDFSFRYFQNLTTSLLLPEDFAPTRVKIRLRPRSGGQKNVEASFDWEVQPG
jgi:hypothetical protein